MARRFALACVALLAAVPALAAAADTATSPHGQVAIRFTLQAGGVPAYAVTYVGKPVVAESRLGFVAGFDAGFSVAATGTSEHSGRWTPVCGERSSVADDYHELTVDLKHATGASVRVTFRAYDQGAALRYTFPAAAAFAGERTEFRFPPDTFCYEEHGTEGEYRRSAIGDVRPWCERPLTLELADGDFACLTEADNERYPRMLLSPADGAPDALVSALGGSSSNLAGRGDLPAPVALAAGESTPWRAIVVGHGPGDLLEHDTLIRNLCPPCAIADPSWVVPGHAMRDTTLTTSNAEQIIAFAAEGGLRYVLFDWRWYGSEDPVTGDATTVRRRGLDLQRVIADARAKGMGVWLYVDRRQAKRQRDVLFPLYEKWGVAGVKIGFVDVGPAAETAWVTETVRRAAEHHLMLDVHDGYRDTGLARTYPNLMTVEGVRGNEHFPTAAHNCTLPFTRFVGGAADYTICYADRRLRTTHGQQLAMAVAYFSPLTMLYWYDRPEQDRGRPELEFYRHVPTTWDETRVIDGQIGRFAVIARRRGDEWFVGALTDEQPRTLRLPLAFLTPGRRYAAHLYADAANVGDVSITTRECSSSDALDLPLQASGGAALWFAPRQP